MRATLDRPVKMPRTSDDATSLQFPTFATANVANWMQNHCESAVSAASTISRRFAKSPEDTVYLMSKHIVRHTYMYCKTLNIKVPLNTKTGVNK